MNVISKRVTIEGINSAYVELGEGPTIVFLHGAYVRASTYSALLERLSERFHVIAPDLPGFGDSQTPPTAWSLAEYSIWLEGLLTTLNIEKAMLVGHSFGGGIALYSAAKSKRVERAIVIDSLGIPTTYGRLELFTRQYILHTYNAFSSMMSVGPYLCMTKDFFVNLFKRPFTFCRIQQILINIIRSSFPQQFSLSVPLLIIWGRQDEILPLANALEIESHAPISTLVEVDGFHDWLIYEPEKAAKRIIEFVESKK